MIHTGRCLLRILRLRFVFPLVSRNFGTGFNHCCLGGKFFNSFLTALPIFFSFFSGLALGSKVLDATPRHMSCFEAGSYTLRSSWPIYTVDVDPYVGGELIPPPYPYHPPPQPGP